MQASRTARNVWLLSATPFPHGNESVFANHELLGFCRLKLNVERTTELEPTDPFEVIKRQIYIRSPGGVRLQAVTLTLTLALTTDPNPVTSDPNPNPNPNPNPHLNRKPKPDPNPGRCGERLCSTPHP